jgi:hypothetical protein
MEVDIALKYRLISGRLLLRISYPSSWHKSVTTRKKMSHDHKVSDRIIKTLEENLERLDSQEAVLAIQAARNFYANHPELRGPFEGFITMT